MHINLVAALGRSSPMTRSAVRGLSRFKNLSPDDMKRKLRHSAVLSREGSEDISAQAVGPAAAASRAIPCVTSVFTNQANMISRRSPVNRTDLNIPLVENTPYDRSRKSRHPFGIRRDERIPSDGRFDMELMFLGTASCVPSNSRGVSSTLLRHKGDAWMFDCGEATQVKLQSSVVRPSKISKIFITHMHGDHTFGLPGLLCLIGRSVLEERGLQEREGAKLPPIEIFGPAGLRSFIRNSLQLTNSKITVPYCVHELHNVPFLHKFSRPPTPVQITSNLDASFGERVGGRNIFPDADGVYHVIDYSDSCELEVKAAPLVHTIPCVGYVITEKERLGELKVDVVQEVVERNKISLQETYGHHYRKVYATLKNLPPGQSFTFPDGVVMSWDDFNSPIQKGRKVVILGDTCDAEPIARIAMDADVLVHEATNAWSADAQNRFPTFAAMARDSYSHGHSTPQSAGRFAHSIRAKQLVLNHFSARYPGDSSEMSMRWMWNIEDHARSEFKPLSPVDGNDVIAAWDHLTLPVR